MQLPLVSSHCVLVGHAQSTFNFVDDKAVDQRRRKILVSTVMYKKELQYRV